MVIFLLFVLVNRPPISRFAIRTSAKWIRFLISAGLFVITVFVVCQWPRWVLVSELRRADTIIVAWNVRDSKGISHEYFFELDAQTKRRLLEIFDENLGLDYCRMIATLPPTIVIFLSNERGDIASCYAIRHAQGGGYWLPNGELGGGRCPSMEVLCDIASHSRRLSEKEMSSISEKCRRSKWPGLFSFDYTLPVVPSKSKYRLPLLPPQDNNSGKVRVRL